MIGSKLGLGVQFRVSVKVFRLRFRVQFRARVRNKGLETRSEDL
jgi:hypothetical protein